MEYDRFIGYSLSPSNIYIYIIYIIYYIYIIYIIYIYILYIYPCMVLSQRDSLKILLELGHECLSPSIGLMCAFLFSFPGSTFSS